MNLVLIFGLGVLGLIIFMFLGHMIISLIKDFCGESGGWVGLLLLLCILSLFLGVMIEGVK